MLQCRLFSEVSVEQILGEERTRHRVSFFHHFGWRRERKLLTGAHFFLYFQDDRMLESEVPRRLSERLGSYLKTMAVPRTMREGRGARAPVVCFFLLMGAMTLVAGQSPVKGGYYVGGPSNLLPASGLDATLYTHLIYAFANLGLNSPRVVIPPRNVRELSTFSSDMKSRNPDVLTLISIFATGAEFGVVLQSYQNQQTFINSSIALARSYNLDGIDMDWEIPRSQADMDAFGLLVAEWRQAVKAEGLNTSRPPLLLTAAVYFNSTMTYTGGGTFPVAAMAENLDFVNVMSYDYHGTWEMSQTGANTNLYDSSSQLNTDHGISSWLDGGMPPEKLVLGLTLYGRSWMLKDQKKANGLRAAAEGAGPAQPRSKSPGIFYYSEVVSFIRDRNAFVVHDMTEVTGYCYADDVWVSYEDPFIIGNKVLYSKSKGLGGYFFWEISQDNDFQISAAASNTMDTGIVEAVPASSPSAGASTASFSILVVGMGILSSVLPLLKWSTMGIVG